MAAKVTVGELMSYDSCSGQSCSVREQAPVTARDTGGSESLCTTHEPELKILLTCVNPSYGLGNQCIPSVPM